MTGKELTPRQRINLIIFLDEMTQDILRRRERGDRTGTMCAGNGKEKDTVAAADIVPNPE